MSKSISRVSNLVRLQRSIPGRGTLNLPFFRSASNHAGHHAQYGPEYETHEGASLGCLKRLLHPAFPYPLLLASSDGFLSGTASFLLYLPQNLSAILPLTTFHGLLGFGNSLFLATGVGIVGLALYHTYVPSSPENEQSLLTRYGQFM